MDTGCVSIGSFHPQGFALPMDIGKYRTRPETGQAPRDEMGTSVPMYEVRVAVNTR